MINDVIERKDRRLGVRFCDDANLRRGAPCSKFRPCQDQRDRLSKMRDLRRAKYLFLGQRMHHVPLKVAARNVFGSD